MKLSSLSAVLLGTLLFSNSSYAVTIPTVLVGNPGNPADTEVMNDGTTGYGSVGDYYRIATTEVTNAQYVEFLNGVDPTGANTLGLYHSDMTSGTRGGIIFTSGAANGSKYSVKSGRDNNPVVSVSWYDSIRFANWLHNGQGDGNTEDGAYTLHGRCGRTPTNGNSITRNAGAQVVAAQRRRVVQGRLPQERRRDGQLLGLPDLDRCRTLQRPAAGERCADAIEHGQLLSKNDGIANGYDDGYAVTGSTSFEQVRRTI